MIANLGYSQVGYPKKMVIDNDTVVCISSKQVRNLNLLKAKSDTYKEFIDTLLSQRSVDSSIIEAQALQIGSLNAEILYNKAITRNVEMVNQNLASNNSSLVKKLKLQKVQATIFGGIAVGIGTLFILKFW